MMNFEYLQKAEPEGAELKRLYADLYEKLTAAEECYWSEPQKCGMILRRAAETICQIYNCFYEIGFSEKDTLEVYLCYTDNDEHNRMVSRFLSVIRMEQRDRLEWLRVWGDECIFLNENPKEAQESQDKLYLDAKKMMLQMVAATKEMCEKLNHMQGLENYSFNESILPGYEEEQKRQESEKENEVKRQNDIFHFFRKK